MNLKQEIIDFTDWYSKNIDKMDETFCFETILDVYIKEREQKPPANRKEQLIAIQTKMILASSDEQIEYVFGKLDELFKTDN